MTTTHFRRQQWIHVVAILLAGVIATVNVRSQGTMTKKPCRCEDCPNPKKCECCPDQRTATWDLGKINLPQAVIVDGKTLPAGTYDVRRSGVEEGTGIGQLPSNDQYVEFVKGGEVFGREMATVVPQGDVEKVVTGTAPKRGTSKVEMLKGNDYVRVWINKEGDNYVINLPTAKKK